MSAPDGEPAPAASRLPPRRHGWLAAFLSLLLPGLGQLYAGRWRRALGFFVVSGLVDFPLLFGTWTFAALLQRPAGFWLAATVGIGIVLFRLAAIVDAALVARRAPRRPLAAYQRWYLYIAIFFAWNAPAFAGMSYPDSGTESYSIPSSAMAPTLQIGDYIIGVKLSGPADLPAPGAIVTSIDPASGNTYVKRLVGLPGDTVEMRDGRLILNGSPVPAEPAGTWRDASGGEYDLWRETLPDGASYLVLEKTDSGPYDMMEALTVPPGHVFLLGDNRDNSRDDRVGGPTPIAALEAKILYVYWSRDLARFGRSLD